MRLSLGAVALLVPAVAVALQQPDGTVIPDETPNNATPANSYDPRLRSYLNAEGESIDPVASAAVTPETFDPSCDLTFKVIARGGTQMNSFGWYNVTGQKPQPSQLYEFIGCGDGVGTQRTLSIKNDPRYAGGAIGFFLATTEGKKPPNGPNCVNFTASGPDPSTLGHVFYSERHYNPDSTAQNPFVHLIILNSVVYPKAFYFGWEDLLSGPANDNDFEDLLMRVEGITCTGGGQACESGALGVCGIGVTQCKNGALTCVTQNSAQPETCNGLDDDCNGEADDGDLCPEGKVCFQGACVAPCGSELPCSAGLACNAKKLCVETACASVECPAGSACKGGSCVAPCDGVSCPLGQTCRLGVCVDVCAGVTCDPGDVCAAGVCKPPCSCAGCPGGQVCGPAGACIDEACASIECPVGTLCQAGSCIDACAGAVCPGGGICEAGVCHPAQSSGEGGGSSSSGLLAVSSSTSAASGASAGAGGQGGEGGEGGGAIIENHSGGVEGGCGCRLAGQRGAAGWPALATLAALASLRRRRRSR